MKTYLFIAKIVSLAFLNVLFLLSCNKTFLEPKSNSSIVVPSTLDDFEKMLDNSFINSCAGLPLLSCDDYFIPDSNVWAAAPATQKNAYIWAKDVFGGELARADWNVVYNSAFYANSVLQLLPAFEEKSNRRGQFIKGWALFVRAYAFYDLVKNFAASYEDVEQAKISLGIPLKMTANVDEQQSRSSLYDTYKQIINDIDSAIPLLPLQPEEFNRNRPSRPAAYALLSKVYLSMGHYKEAELYADSCLALYDKLLDYNTIDPNSSSPFKRTNNEVILYANQVNGLYHYVLYNTAVNISVDTTLYQMFEDTDLRKQIFFMKVGNFIKPKRGYTDDINLSFTGLATDEVHLIKAECALRNGNIRIALQYLNKLLEHRFRKGYFEPITQSDPDIVLKIIKMERRKQLFWRCGVRWEDIKRFNREGDNIILQRQLGSDVHILEPGSPKYVFPIPDDEIALSNLIQNPR